MKEMVQRRKFWLRLIITLDAFLALVIIAFLIRDYYPQIKLLLDPARETRMLKHMFRNHGPKDMFLLLLLTATTSAIPALSSSVVCIFNGILFGPWIGLLLNVGGNTLGNIVVTFVLQKVGLRHESKKLGHVIEGISKFKNKMVGMIIGYMVPVIPSFLVNFTALKLKMKPQIQLICIVIGIFPSSFLYAFGGDAIFNDSDKKIILALVCLLALVGLYYVIRKKYQQKIA